MPKFAVVTTFKDYVSEEDRVEQVDVIDCSHEEAEKLESQLSEIYERHSDGNDEAYSVAVHELGRVRDIGHLIQEAHNRTEGSTDEEDDDE